MAKKLNTTGHVSNTADGFADRRRMRPGVKNAVIAALRLIIPATNRRVCELDTGIILSV